MNKPTLLNRALAGAVVLFGALEFAQAGVVDPTQPVAGISQLELSQQWWQWALGIPAFSNPHFDTTGALAHTNNNGPVFFLAGNFSGGVLCAGLHRTSRHPDLFPGN